jgi:predicted aspartyl protease
MTKEDLKLKTKVKIFNPTDFSKFEELELLIDTGATFSVISQEILKKIGIKLFEKMKFKLATGETIERETGIVGFEIEGKGKGGGDVIFGKKGDAQVLGLLTLEAMALKVNTVTGELEPIELYLL